jgi:hypothetical protein
MSASVSQSGRSLLRKPQTTNPPIAVDKLLDARVHIDVLLANTAGDHLDMCLRILSLSHIESQ